MFISKIGIMKKDELVTLALVIGTFIAMGIVAFIFA